MELAAAVQQAAACCAAGISFLPWCRFWAYLSKPLQDGVGLRGSHCGVCCAAGALLYGLFSRFCNSFRRLPCVPHLYILRSRSRLQTNTRNQLTDHRRASCATLQQHVLSGFTTPCAILVAGLLCRLGPMGCWHAASSGTLLMPQMQRVLAWTLHGQQDRDARADRVPALSCMQAAGRWVEGLGAKVL